MTSLPGIFLDYQKRWVADNSQVKIYEKSRRIGATWAEAGDCVLYAGSAKGDDCWYIGYNKEMAHEFIVDCSNWAKIFNRAATDSEEILLEDQDKDILSYRINFSSGHRITALSSRPTNLRGKHGRVIIDEAAFHENLPGLMKAAVAMLIWGGRVSVISTHNGEANHFNELVNDCRAGKLPYSLHRTTFDDALADGLYKRICLTQKKKWTEDDEKKWIETIYALYGIDADEELLCIPSSGTGEFLPKKLIESCMESGIDIVRYSRDKEFTYLDDYARESQTKEWIAGNLAPILESKVNHEIDSYIGVDFGRTGDLSAIWLLQETQKLSLKTPAVIELRNIPFRQQEQIVFYLIDNLNRFGGGAFDARGNGQYLAEVAMQRYGQSRINQVMLSVDWYRDNMPVLKSDFEEKNIEIPKDKDILEDFRLLTMSAGVARIPDNKHTKGYDGHQRHGDTVIAYALARFAVRNMGASQFDSEVLSASAEIPSEYRGYFNPVKYKGY